MMGNMPNQGLSRSPGGNGAAKDPFPSFFLANGTIFESNHQHGKSLGNFGELYFRTAPARCRVFHFFPFMPPVYKTSRVHQVRCTMAAWKLLHP